jgi:hypothetical protein
VLADGTHGLERARQRPEEPVVELPPRRQRIPHSLVVRLDPDAPADLAQVALDVAELPRLPFDRRLLPDRAQANTVRTEDLAHLDEVRLPVRQRELADERPEQVEHHCSEPGHGRHSSVSRP